MDLTNPHQNIQYKVGATNRDLQRAIEAAVPAAVAQMKNQCSQFRGNCEKETARKIFDFLKTQVHYKVDGDNQKIKLPSGLLREREGDCKSYALFTAAVLSNLKIPYKFCYASYNPYDRTPEHIYVVTNKGTIIDAVWGKFDSEKKANYKFYKPMNISYISGIKGPKKEVHHKHTHTHKHHYYKGLGSTGHMCGTGGIGRTWADWAKAVGVYDKFTKAMVTEYWAKNLEPVTAAIRGIFEQIISKNAGGIANFLYNLSPFNTGEINQTNLSLLTAGRDLLTKKLNEKYPLANAAQSNFSQATYQTITDPKTGQTYKVLLSNDTNVAAKQKQLESWTKEFNAGVVELYKKYPFIIKGASTPQAQAKYRELELWWLKNLGGNPDDFNKAVKEGNSKTPVGKVFNYLIAKYANGQNPGIGLTLRAMADALVFGKKFQLGDKDAFNVTFYGVKQGANISDLAMNNYLNSIGIKGTKGIGLDPATDAAIVEKTGEITIAGYSTTTWLELLGGILVLYKSSKDLFKDPSGNLNDQQQSDIQNQNAANAQTGILSGGTSTYLLIGGGVLAAYYLLSKK